MEARDEGHLSMSVEQQAVALISQGILERFDNLPASDEEYDERSDTQSEPGNEPEVAGEHTSATRPHKRRAQDQEETSRFWFPWPDRISCTLDILMHLPHSVFSHRQLDLFLWLLKAILLHQDTLPFIHRPAILL
ncbi:hypothetical protein B0H10DRAFT_176928 [Mycena sp. CBHHK59/15]|nr:hypothetical protein B0H10DRAFT_176928 [Mycena sp. CBHHK59/15]